MLASLLFAAYALVALVAGALVIAARRPQTGVRSLQWCMIAVACAYVQVMAPAVAAAQGVLLGAATIATLRMAVGEEIEERQRWWRIGLAVAPVAALALVLVSTWARQYVWTGRALPPGSRFGEAALMGQAWSELYAPTLGLAALALTVAAIAGLAARGHR